MAKMTLLLESVNLGPLSIWAAVINYVNGYVNMLTSPETRPHHSITVSQMGIPGVHHRRRPQDMTEMNKKIA